jgi:hypothetical protein
MTWSFQLENGCVPAARDRAADALGGVADSSRRMLADPRRSSVTSAQILVPTSTIDWCISRLI